MSKVLIAVLKDRKLPSKQDTTPVSLEKRAQYAIDCIEADMPNRAKAIQFLTHIKDRLDNPELVSQIEKVLSDGT